MKNSRLFHSRLTVLVAVVGVGFVVLLWRLIDIQLWRGAEYRFQADDNRYLSVRIPPERGIFFDRYGQPLVKNSRVYYLVDDPDQVHSSQSPIDVSTARGWLATDSGRVRFGIERQYLFPRETAHVLGYVGPVTTQDLLTDKSLHVSDYLGKAGLEQQFDQQLRGQAGQEQHEIDAFGHQQKIVVTEPGQAGVSFQTTIDPYLSQAAVAAIGDQRGAVIVMNAKNGEILSLVSNPGFDANALSSRALDRQLEVERQRQLQQLLTDPNNVFFDRAVGGVYPPGSVFKLVTAIAGLESAVVDQHTAVLDEGVLKVGQYEYANWYFTQYGRTEGEISLLRAIARSNDIYFYQVAEWLGPDRLAEFARLFGFDQPTGIEVGHEAAGTIPDPAWKERVIGEPWYLGNTFHMGIGQGDVLVSPLQVAQLIQAIANHGTLCRPHLITTSQPDCVQVGVDEANLDLVLEGMIQVCSTGGTAFPFFTYNQSVVGTSEGDGTDQVSALSPRDKIDAGAIACKTGTAEFGATDEQGYRRTHGWLAAVVGTAQIKQLAKQAQTTAPTLVDTSTTTTAAHQNWLRQLATHPLPDELVIVALVESDQDQPFKEGSADAGPVVKSILDWMNGVE